MGYQDDIAAWRLKRQQQQIADRCNQIQSEYREVQRERDQAIADNDMETAECRDYDCQQLEQEWAQYNPPQQQEHPTLTRFRYQNQDYLNKVRERVGPEHMSRFLNWADWKLTAPPNQYDPKRSGMGLQRYSPAYYQRGRDLLELYSEQSTGVKYDSGDRLPMKSDVAKMSGLSDQEYANAERAMASQGRFSWQNRNR